MCTSWWKFHFKRIVKHNKIDTCQKKLKILTDGDAALLCEIRAFQNNPIAMLKLAFPAVGAMALCPITLFLYDPLVEFLWPPDKFKTLPDINMAIICFLMPAGMIYATTFGFFCKDVMGEFTLVSSGVSRQTAMIRQIAMLTCAVKGFTNQQKRRIILALKDQVMTWLKSITRFGKKDAGSFQTGKIFSFITFAKT